MVLSFNFLELGHAALCSEATWTTPVVLRSGPMSKLDGGWSRFLTEYLRIQLLGAHGLVTAGIPLVIDGRPVLLHARLTHAVADGEGHALWVLLSATHFPLAWLQRE